MSEATTRMLDWHVERVKEAHAASGAVETVVTHWMPDTGWHLLGTARMGDDPATAVVDRWCRSHDVPNLYVVDGSVFPDRERHEPDGDDLRRRVTLRPPPDRLARPPGGAGSVSPDQRADARRARATSSSRQPRACRPRAR